MSAHFSSKQKPSNDCKLDKREMVYCKENCYTRTKHVLLQYSVALMLINPVNIKRLGGSHLRYVLTV